jgi:cytochrome b subunit of formate dehydrogenase
MSNGFYKKLGLAFLIVVIFVLLVPKPALGADTEGCLTCHGQPGFNTVIAGKTISLYVDGDKMALGMHKDRKCTDCHPGFSVGTGSGAEGPHSTDQISTFAQDALNSCQKCHDKEFWEFKNSPHGKASGAGGDVETTGGNEVTAPTCSRCHEKHYTLSSKDETSNTYKLNSPEKLCEPCHVEAFETYIENYHGKELVQLGYVRSASCADCHGAHTANALTNKQDAIKACEKCHPGANENFVGYAVHGNENDAKAYPMMFWIKWIMTALLIFALGFFYLHSLLWAIKDVSLLRAKRKAEAEGKMATDGGEAFAMPAPVEETKHEPVLYRRFNWFHLTMHYLMLFTFMALVFTGMPLRYRGAAWAKAMITTLGGPGTAGMIHRIAAGITLFYFIAEVIYGVGYMYIIRREPIFGPNSMFPRWKDLKDLGNNMKYFVGRGEKPKFDRYTYWEKFDYLAVFWGMFAIGATGLFLWFPVFFSKIIPGQIFNVATIMHSDEAVLAAFFIFIVHWFNTHWRPGKFPMDPVIFTGIVTEEEIKEERPLEWERMQSDPELKRRMRVERKKK